MKIRHGLPCILAAVLCSALTGCVTPTGSVDSAQLSPFQVRAMQTRTYEKLDNRTALKTIVDVLQDEGFFADYANVDLGLLHATKTVGEKPVYYSNTIIEATINVSEFGERTRVRVNLQQKIVNRYSGFSGYGYGPDVTVQAILDPAPYQDFFTKLERGVFIQKQGL